jgi:uncharacterized protein (DUF1330 family)
MLRFRETPPTPQKRRSYLAVMLFVKFKVEDPADKTYQPLRSRFFDVLEAASKRTKGKSTFYRNVEESTRITMLVEFPDEAKARDFESDPDLAAVVREAAEKGLVSARDIWFAVEDPKLPQSKPGSP